MSVTTPPPEGGGPLRARLMVLRALQNPVRSARIVGYGNNTLAIEIETDRGRYRWDVRPIYRFEIERVRSEFKQNWKAALKDLIADSIGIYPTRLNPASRLRWEFRSRPEYSVWTAIISKAAMVTIEHSGGDMFHWYLLRRSDGKLIALGKSGSWSEAVNDVLKAARAPRMMFNFNVECAAMSGWIHAPELSTPNFRFFYKKMGYDRVLGATELNRGAGWFVYDRGKTVMHGTSGNLSEAMGHAEDAYHQWIRGKPRAMFNARVVDHIRAFRVWAERYGSAISRRSSIDVKHDSLDFQEKFNLTDREYHRLRYLMEEASRGRWPDSWRPRTLAGHKTLFNARLQPARWWVGQREDGTWDLQKARSAMRFPWINIVGPFPNKTEATKEMRRRNFRSMKKPRTLFNRTARLLGTRGIRTGENKGPGQSGLWINS